MSEALFGHPVFYGRKLEAKSIKNSVSYRNVSMKCLYFQTYRSNDVPKLTQCGVQQLNIPNTKRMLIYGPAGSSTNPLHEVVWGKDQRDSSLSYLKKFFDMVACTCFDIA